MTKIIQIFHVGTDHLLALDDDGTIWDGWYGLDPDEEDRMVWKELNGPPK